MKLRNIVMGALAGLALCVTSCGPQEDTRTMEELTSAAEGGDIQAALEIGKRYQEGRGGVEKSDAKAGEWFVKAATLYEKAEKEGKEPELSPGDLLLVTSGGFKKIGDDFDKSMKELDQKLDMEMQKLEDELESL